MSSGNPDYELWPFFRLKKEEVVAFLRNRLINSCLFGFVFSFSPRSEACLNLLAKTFPNFWAVNGLKKKKKSYQRRKEKQWASRFSRPVAIMGLNG